MPRRTQPHIRLIDNTQSPYAMLLEDDWMLEVDTNVGGGGNVIVNLPTTADADRRDYVIKKIDRSANTVSITPNVADQIDRGGAGVAAVISARNVALRIVADAANNNWIIY